MNYPEHYRACRAAFVADGGADDPLPLRGVRILRFGPDLAHPLFPVDAGYFTAIDGLADGLARRLADLEANAYVPATLAAGGDIAVRLHDPFSLPQLDFIADALIAPLERSLYGCHVLFDRVYAYRNLVTDAVERGSWLWHYDNHPAEIMKVMIYLTDVDESTGPFEYLADAEGEPILIPPSRLGPTHWKPSRWKGARVSPAAMAAFEAEGAHGVKVTGPRGTTILFDNNVIHRANRAVAAHRDVIVLQLRPVMQKLRPRLNPNVWTGSFQHEDFSRDPERVEAVLR